MITDSVCGLLGSVTETTTAVTTQMNRNVHVWFLQLAVIEVVVAVVVLLPASTACGVFGAECLNDSSCIPGTAVCDGARDCADGSDEAVCPAGSCAKQGMYTCSGGGCIPWSNVCDFVQDCAGGSDENALLCSKMSLIEFWLIMAFTLLLLDVKIVTVRIVTLRQGTVIGSTFKMKTTLSGGHRKALLVMQVGTHSVTHSVLREILWSIVCYPTSIDCSTEQSVN